jgi:cell division transport system permease protein
MIDRGVKEYESKLTNEYTIVIVSVKSLKPSELKKRVSSINSIKEIDTQKYIKMLSKENISNSDLVYLKSALPHFYTLNLTKLPSEQDLTKIKSNLLSINGVLKVETYKKAYKKLHQFLLLTKGASYLFTIFIFIISILLIIKQMEIWTYEHNNRMYIMGLFGAPYWLKSAPLYKLVIIDSVIATILVSLSFLYLPYLVDLAKIHNDMGIELRNFYFFSDTLFLLFLSITISVVAVSITILKQEK